MKFIVPAGPLLSKLNSVNGAVLSKPVIPSIENFLFDLKNGNLTITTTDLETYMQESIEVQSSEDVRICVPSKETMDLLKLKGDEPVTFTINPENSNIEISTTSGGRYNNPGANAEDFPESPVFEAENSFEIPTEVLVRAINKTLFATGTDDLRLALTGVYLEIKNDVVNFVATDANRLVKFTTSSVKPGFEAGIIIPKKSLNLLKNSLSGQGDTVKVEIDSSNIRFSCGSLVLISRIMDEKFPDYEMVIPKDNNNILTVSRKNILNVANSVAVMANKQTHQIRLKVVGSQLSVQSEDIEKSSAGHEDLACEYDGEDIEIGFNAKFLIELLNNLEDDEIKIKFSTPSRAGLIVPQENEENEEILMLLMPMMLNNY